MFIRKFVITIYQSLDKSVYHICIYRISKTIEVKTNQKLSLFFVCDAQITHEMQD